MTCSGKQRVQRSYQAARGEPLLRFLACVCKGNYSYPPGGLARSSRPVREDEALRSALANPSAEANKIVIAIESNTARKSLMPAILRDESASDDWKIWLYVAKPVKM